MNVLQSVDIKLKHIKHNEGVKCAKILDLSLKVLTAKWLKCMCSTFIYQHNLFYEKTKHNLTFLGGNKLRKMWSVMSIYPSLHPAALASPNNKQI